MSGSIMETTDQKQEIHSGACIVQLHNNALIGDLPKDIIVEGKRLTINQAKVFREERSISFQIGEGVFTYSNGFILHITDDSGQQIWPETTN